MTDPRYPVGKFTWPEKVGDDDRRTYIQQIEETPAKLRAAVKWLKDKQLDTPYRDGGWTVRQVVHHLADSHLNAYIRFKLALTENEPTIKPYEQQLWAELVDAKSGDAETSLTLLECLHRRWVAMLKAMTPADFERKFRHPEMGVLDLNKYLAQYAWHGRHHVAHITALAERMGW
jgi:DinB family protein